MTLRELFCDRNFNNKLVTLAVPMTLQSLMVALVAAADALMLGKLDQDAMAAVSLATNCPAAAVRCPAGFLFHKK